MKNDVKNHKGTLEHSYVMKSKSSFLQKILKH
jgi:hypothetical protein